MAKKKMDPHTAEERSMAAEIIRRRCMLMAAAEGCTQTALQERLLTEYWEQNYSGGALDAVLSHQLDNGG